MTDAVVVGAGIAGLGSALALSRAGHRVTLLERDHTPMPESADDAFWWGRTGAPQVRHSHVLLARLRNLLRDRYPDVLDALHAAGVEDRRMTDDLPDTIDDRSPQPGDEDLYILAGRRTTFEWVLRSVVLADPLVSLRDGVAVTGITMDAGLVTGVTTSDGETIGGDVVLVANGRRADVPTWAAPHGIDIAEEVEESGIVYLSRFYRRDAGVPRPEGSGFGTADLGYVKAGLFPCDHDSLSVTLATAVDDTELRKKLMDPDTFERGCRALPRLAPWLEPGTVDPLSDVFFMGGLINRTRMFLDDGGAPLLPGLFAVGDAHTCTNPIYGRGCSLALVMATEAADAIDAHSDPTERAVAYEAAVKRDVAPWFKASIMQDRAAKAAGKEMAPGGAFGPALSNALRTDAVVLRAFLRMLNLLSSPKALMSDPDLLARFAAAAERDDLPPVDVGPTSRSEFVALLHA